jgi:undecaprenyl-phosphate 4-deoxy-4-formamido-L-arabinose transferase
LNRSRGVRHNALPGGASLNPPSISAVVPIHNEEGNIPELHRRLDAAMKSLGRPYEIIYIDDGSADRSLALLLEIRQAQPDQVVVLELYRNYGQFRALTAGFERVRGEIVVTLDADLQNPPEEIPKLVRLLEEGSYDVVNGWRRNRQDSAFRRMASRAANRIAATLTGVRMRDYGCMLRAYRRDVVRQITACREQSPYIPTLANALARRATEVEVAHAARHSGRSNYSLWKLIHLQYDMVTSFSVLPLRWLSVLGAAVAALSLLAGAGMFVASLYGVGEGLGLVPALVIVLFLLLGVIFVTLGFVGEYVGRIYNEVRQRPRFVVRTVHSGRGAQPRPGREEIAEDESTPGPRRIVDLRDDGWSGS